MAAHKLGYMGVFTYPFIPLGPHRVETLGGSAFSPVTPNGASCIIVQALAQNVRYTLDGTAPTAAVGFQLSTTAGPLRIELVEGCLPQFFRESSGAFLQYCYGK